MLDEQRLQGFEGQPAVGLRGQSRADRLGLGFAERGRAAENGEARRRRGIALQPAREFLSRLGVASELIPEPRAQRGRAATQVDEEAHGRALFRIREQALEEVTMTRGVHGWAKR